MKREEDLARLVQEAVTAAMADQLLDTDEAAAFLEMSTEAFCKRHDRGLFPFRPFKGRRRLLWTRGDLATYKRSNK